MSLNQEQYEKLEAYVGGELEPAARADVDKLLAGNPQLRKLMAELITARDLVRGLPRSKAPADLIETFQGQIERAELFGDTGPAESDVLMKISRWPQYMSVAAVIFLALGLAGIVYKVVLPHNKPGGFAMGPTGDEKGSVDDREGLPTTRPESIDKLRSELASVPAMSPSASGGAAGPAPVLSSETPLAILRRADASKAKSTPVDAGQLAHDAQDEPIVMVVRSENPAQANTEVRRFFLSNTIPFDATSQSSAVSVAAGIEASPDQNPTTDLTKTALSPESGSVQRARGSMSPDRAQAIAGASNYSEPATQQTFQPLPSAAASAYNSSNSQAAANELANSSRGRGFAYNAAASQAAPLAQATTGSVANAGRYPIIAQTQPNAGNVYRAMLTQSQIHDLNTRLQSQGNGWTEMRNAPSTDALDGNPIDNAINPRSTVAENLRIRTLETMAKKESGTKSLGLANESEASTQPAAAVQPFGAGLAVKDSPLNDMAARDSKAATLAPTTAPTTAPAPEAVAAKPALASELREVLIIVNEQPIDLIGAPTATATTLPARTPPPATTQPATSAPAEK